MSEPAALPARTPWFATRRFRVAFLLVIGLLLAGQSYLSVFVRANDVANHHHFGRKWLNAVPGEHAYYYWYVPYPAGRGSINAVLAVMPYHVFRAVCFLLGVAAAVGSLVLWERMARGRRPVAAGVPFAAAAAAVLLLLRWVLRDLDDCGLQLMLLFMLTACFALWHRNRDSAAGGWLGLAVVYKASPLLLVPFAVLTRRWRTVGVAVATVVLLSLSPAIFLGWERMVVLNEGFVELTRKAGRLGDPAENGFEPPRHLNQGLVVALSRVLQTYPPDHPLYLNHPLFVQFLDLPAPVADKVAKAVVALLVGIVAWRVGRKVWRSGRDADLVPEWAALTLLCALLSPMCWTQHLTLSLPAAYLVLRDGFDRLARGERPLRRNVAGLLAVVVLMFGFSRELLGRELGMVFLSYKVNTLAALLLFGLVLALPPVPVTATESAPERQTGGWLVPLRRLLPGFTRRT